MVFPPNPFYKANNWGVFFPSHCEKLCSDFRNMAENMYPNCLFVLLCSCFEGLRLDKKYYQKI